MLVKKEHLPGFSECTQLALEQDLQDHPAVHQRRYLIGSNNKISCPNSAFRSCLTRSRAFNVKADIENKQPRFLAVQTQANTGPRRLRCRSDRAATSLRPTEDLAIACEEVGLSGTRDRRVAIGVVTA